MRARRAFAVVAVAVTTAGSFAITAAPVQAAPPPPAPSGGPSTQYVVAAATGASPASAEAAVRRAGGRVVKVNRAVGTLTVTAPERGFVARVAAERALAGAARNAPVAKAPDAAARRARPAREQVERLTRAERAAARAGTAPTRPAAARVPGAPDPEPLGALQWDMQQIGATPTGSYARDRGDRRVKVGIIDTGVDGSHPDIAPNFDRRASRNFVTDIPLIDGPCEVASCVDPADVDEDGHGTHVASTIGSPLNRLGIAGVAPDVTLVNIRAGQDSGYFFLGPVVDALSYAGDSGVDVVNMSFYVDPWLFNCPNNPADSPEDQLEQRTIISVVQRAVDYARGKGVTLVAAMGNQNTDLGRPTTDESSPNFPPGEAYPRTVDNTCLDVPTETRGVIAVTSTGPSLRKAYYSNYGTEQADVAAPGGDAYDSPDNRLNVGALVLAAYPESVALAVGDIEVPGGPPTTPFVVRSCRGSVCAYYQYLQGTSMAAPHAAGVAALIVGRYGTPDRRRAGLTLAPARTQQVLYATATEKACPRPRVYTYTIVRSTGTTTLTATCRGGLQKNGFYGRGIVNAQAAVSGRR